MPGALKEVIDGLVRSKPANVYVVREVIKAIIEYTNRASSDDVRFYVKEFDPSPMVIGMAFKQLVAEGVIKKLETEKTKIKSSKGRDIVVYVQV